jgi:hypothetical protein
VRLALARKLEAALHVWSAAPAATRPGGGGDLVRPLRAIAAQVEGVETAEEQHDYLFPAGVPERVGAADLLRAFRHAAAREQRSLVRLVSLTPTLESHGTIIEHEIGGRSVLVVRLWVIALKWYGLAAGRAGVGQARSLHALAEKWKRIEQRVALCLDA